MQDRDGAKLAIQELKQYWQSSRVLFADGGYQGQLIEWTKQLYNISLHIIKRTFAWIDANRRSAKNDERLTKTSQAIVQLAVIRVMINRF